MPPYGRNRLVTTLATFDPGITGAVAISTARDHVLSVHDLPVMGEGKQVIINGTALAELLLKNGIDHAVIEFVAAMPGQGVSSMFKFGRSFGQVIGVVQGLKTPHEFVTPAKWKRDMKLPGGDAGKEVARRRAIELFPHLADYLARKKDHNRAEALLLGRWWWENNRPQPTKRVKLRKKT